MCGCKGIGRRQAMKSMMAGTALAGLAPWCLAGCAVNPATGQSSFTGFMSPDDEKRVGTEQFPVLVKEFGGEYRDSRLNSYLTSLGNELVKHSETPDAKFTFAILNSDIVNAFALPGGYVCVSRGLMALCQDEAELAGVVGHEIGHVVARHSAQRYSQGMATNIGLIAAGLGLSVLGAGQAGQSLMNVAQYGAQAFLQSYSREHEMEADQLGLRYLSRSGYEPVAMVNFLESLRKHSILQARMAGQSEGNVDHFDMMATHPLTKDRIQAAQQGIGPARAQNARFDRKAYLDAINGMLFGDDPEQGMLKGRSFLHPSMRFGFDVPKGFRVSNMPSKVVASNPQGAAIIFDGAKPRGSGSMAAFLTREWAVRSQVTSVETINLNGMEAATGLTQGNTQGGQPVAIRLLAIRFQPDLVFRFMFLAPRNQAHAFDEAFRSTTYSFRRLSAEEAAKVKPLRLIVVEARAGDTPEKLGATMPFEDYNPDWFKLLNDIDPGQPLKSGQTIKVVAG
ncbi:MAG: M48 family metalloprotease [Alphaproteobacteria bacterium]|nr:M48 family metalloprotease [Alphaproteobacteria bacterium]